MLKRSWWVLLCLVVMVACERSSTEVVELDGLRLQREVEQRVMAALERPAVDAAFDGFFTAIASDPALAARGEELAGKLMVEPRLAGSVELLLGRVQVSPEVERAVERLMAQHPDASPEEIGELAGQEFERAWDRPAVQAAWSGAWETFMDKLDARASRSMLERALTQRIAQLIDEREAMKKFSVRLVKLNGGTRPDRTRATDLYLEHAWNPQRIDAMVIRLLEEPAFRRATAAALADVLAIEPVAEAARDAAVTALEDKGVQDAVVKALLLFYRDEITTEQAREALVGVIAHPTVLDAAGSLLGTVTRHPQLAAIGARWFDDVRNAPAIVAAFRAFWNEW